jgi:dihydroneopterin aldolase
MDSLTIRKLKLTCSIGVYDWEKEVPQDIFADIELPLDISKSVKSDQLEDTLDYTRLVEIVKSVAAAQHYNLVETLVEKIAQAVLQEFDLEKVKVCIDKPAAIPEAESTVICIERSA